MVAGWNVDVKVGSLPERVATAFSGLNNLVGAEYSPIAYLGSQVVNGVNHAVLAEQTIITGKDTKNVVLVIFNEKPQSLDSMTLVSIERVVEGGEGFGGTVVDVETEINKTAQALFDRVLGGFVGTVVTPFALLATQVVRGTNFVFACETQPVLADNDENNKKVVLAVINDLDDNVGFVDILTSSMNRSLGCPLGEWP